MAQLATRAKPKATIAIAWPLMTPAPYGMVTNRPTKYSRANSHAGKRGL